MGGSRVKLATVENGAVVESEIFPVAPDGFTGTLAELERRIASARGRHPSGWDGIGIALPGIIDEDRCRVLSCNAKHAGVENVDIAAWAQEKLSLPCRVINDARVALLGELNFGCAKGEQNAVMMILGTGVGTSAVCRGHVERGVNVLNLVEGEEATVESPTGAFAPFTVHYAETFIIPASVGRYTIRPSGPGAEKLHATIKASVRT